MIAQETSRLISKQKPRLTVIGAGKAAKGRFIEFSGLRRCRLYTVFFGGRGGKEGSASPTQV